MSILNIFKKKKQEQVPKLLVETNNKLNNKKSFFSNYDKYSNEPEFIKEFLKIITDKEEYEVDENSEFEDAIKYLIENNYLASYNINDNLIKTLNNKFKDLEDLTSYFVENSYRELYKTIGTTKLINATGGKRIFIAVPSNRVTRNLRFYVNSANVSGKIGVDVDTEKHPIIETRLNVADSNGTLVTYRIFYTDERYNSNSVMLEVREI